MFGLRSLGHRLHGVVRTRSPFADCRREYRVLFFGTDEVSLATLSKLHENSQLSPGTNSVVDEIQVVCPSDRKIGRRKKKQPVPVKQFALDNGIPVIEVPANLKSLKKWELPVTSPFDVGVVVSFGYFLHPHLLRHLRHGAINMHPSLLPKYRGPAPIHHALLNGDETTGISVIEIDPKAFDVGRILLQKHVPVPPHIQLLPLSQQLASIGGDCVIETLENLHQYKENAMSQDDALATKAPKVNSEQGVLDLDDPAASIFKKWQALGDNVGVVVSYQDRIVKLIDIRLPTETELDSVLKAEANHQISPGTFFYDKPLKALWLKCGDNSWLLVTKLQQADKRVGEALDFANGYRLKHHDPHTFTTAKL